MISRLLKGHSFIGMACESLFTSHLLLKKPDESKKTLLYKPEEPQLVNLLRRTLIMSPSWTFLCMLSVAAGCCQLSYAQQLVQPNSLPQTQASANVTINYKSPPGSVAKSSVGSNDFEVFKKSPLFVEPFDPTVLSLPAEHLAFLRSIIKEDIVLYRTILNESIEKRNKMAASVRLMLKYGGRLISNFIKHRREERKLTQKVEPKPEFFMMLADLITEVANLSSQMKSKYSKKTINIEEFRMRVETLLDTLGQTVEISPVASYMNWSKSILYKDQPRNGIHNRRCAEEAADLVAQHQVMGYENTNFMIRRLANMCRLFARGVVPASDKDV